jgi:hypothetical protein
MDLVRQPSDFELAVDSIRDGRFHETVLFRKPRLTDAHHRTNHCSRGMVSRMDGVRNHA